MPKPDTEKTKEKVSTALKKDESSISPTGDQIADSDELTKIILFSFIGLGVVLLVITKLMKSSSQK